MQFVYTEKLKEYMKAKNRQYILIEAYHSNGCTGCSQLSTQFLDEKTAKRYKKQQCPVAQGEIGEILMPGTKLTETKDVITLDLGNFLGLKTVLVDGLKA